MNHEELLSRLMSAQATAQVETLLANLSVVPPEQYQWLSADERSGPWQDGKLHWVPVGRDRGNGGRIKLAGEPVNPLAERLVNGMEALIEHARLRELAQDRTTPAPASPRDAVLRYFGFPKLDVIERLENDDRKQKRALADKVRKNLSITLHFEKKSREFSVTVRDRGMGQAPQNIHKTLLSLGRTDKADKPYLIGVFGQGGSSAFSIAKYSIVISRRAADIRNGNDDGGAGWTVVREILPKGRRDPYYAYLAISEGGEVPSVSSASADRVGFTHGAHFCHVGYDFGGSEQSVARTMYQSLNHVLFNPILPYELFALKEKPEPMLGTAQRLARRVRILGQSVALDKSFAAQPVL